MKKIPTIFRRDPENMQTLLNEPHPDCDWVFQGEGVATRKYDGTCVMINKEGEYFKRREVKPGKKAPKGFIELSKDPNTKKRMGWLWVDPEDPANKYHMEAYAYCGFERSMPSDDFTFELIGPKINGNPENCLNHYLKPHCMAESYKNVPLDFGVLRKWLKGKDIEGLVFKHPDGRMAKIKLKDFGLTRNKQRKK